MMRSRNSLCVLAILLGCLIPTDSFATVPDNGESLLVELERDMAYWESPTEEGKKFFGQGISYVQGARDAAIVLQPGLLCVPNEITNLNLVQGIVRQIDKSPELQAAPRVEAMIRAIQAEWPCDRKR